jgi:TfoX/Sxy family transcriptional regulator of competence genes
MNYNNLYKLLGEYADLYIRMKIPKKLTIREDLNTCVYIYYDPEEILEKKLCFEQIVRNAVVYKEKRREKRREERRNKSIQCGRFLVRM